MAACSLPPSACMPTRPRMKLKRSAFWLLLKGCPNYQGQMACLIPKITLVCNAAERTVFCYLHLKEHKPQCRVTCLPLTDLSLSHPLFHTVSHSTAFMKHLSREERLKRKEKHERRQECIKTLSTTPTSMNQHDAECFQTCLGVHWHDQAWMELIRDAFSDDV